MPEPTEMYVYASGDVEIAPDGRPISVRADGQSEGRFAIPMQELQANVASFIEGTRLLMSQVEETVGNYDVDEVEIAAQIGADGKVGFLGSGVGVRAGTSFKLILKRKG